METGNLTIVSNAVVRKTRAMTAVDVQAPAFGSLMRGIQPEGTANARSVKAMGCWSLVHGLALLLLDGMLEMPEGVEADTWLAQVIGITVASNAVP